MKTPTDEQCINVAQHFHAIAEGTLEVDDNAIISRTEGNPCHGAYVQAWIWVPDEDTLNAP